MNCRLVILVKIQCVIAHIFRTPGLLYFLKALHLCNILVIVSPRPHPPTHLYFSLDFVVLGDYLDYFLGYVAKVENRRVGVHTDCMKLVAILWGRDIKT